MPSTNGPMNLDALRVIAEAATKGPWLVYKGYILGPEYIMTHDDKESMTTMKPEDAEFISTFNPACVLDLLALVREQKEVDQRCNELVETLAAILYADERGQGVGYKEAMDRAARLVNSKLRCGAPTGARWSTEKPTKEGWYWYRGTDNKPNMVYVYLGLLEMRAAALCDENWEVSSMCGEWFGPIDPPREES